MGKTSLKNRRINPEHRNEYLAIQNLRLSAKIFAFLAMFFMVVGLFVFLDLYLDHVQGRFLQVIFYPTTFAIFTLPFLPFVILWLLSTRKEKQYVEQAEAFLKKLDSN